MNTVDYLNKNVKVIIDRKMGSTHPKHGCQYFLKISLKNTFILLAKISPYVFLGSLPLAAEAGSRFNFCFKF